MSDECRSCGADLDDNACNCETQCYICGRIGCEECIINELCEDCAGEDLFIEQEGVT